MLSSSRRSKLRDKKEEKKNIAVKISPASSQMFWKHLITVKSDKILCHLCSHPFILYGGAGLFCCSFVYFFYLYFFSPCAPVLVLVMGKEAVHGGNLNKKAHAMAEYLRKSGY